jgi:polyhydroxyalkanoate synthesis regulator phasin
MDTLPDNWLGLAASHGATGWVRNFIKAYLPRLKDQAISAQQFALHFSDELDSRNLTTPAQQKNYRSNLCQALKTLDPGHPAIALISPSAEEYRELNDAQRGKLADRETRYFTSNQAQTLVDRATDLLDSAEWSDVGAGLAVLLGRRISEILLSRFSSKSLWSITFSEMAKKQGTEGLTIEIPTLAPADVVLKAIERLQKGLRIEDLKLNSLSLKMAKQAVNQRYSDSVAAKCVEHFSPLVPARSDRENLYTHVFRAVYATIAAHWFCPVNVPEHSFKAEIQGHFTLTKDGKKLPNYSARANYDDYAIGAKDGNRDGRLGIKLGLLPGLQPIEAFRKTQPQRERQTMNGTATTTKDQDFEQIWESLSDAPQEPLREHPTSSTEPIEPTQTELTQTPVEEQTPVSQPTEKTKTKRPELHADDLARMTEMMAKRGITGSAAELFHSLLEAFESGESQQQQQQTRTVSDLTSSLTWFTDRIDTLERTCQQLQAERDRLQAAQTTTEELNRLRGENTQLKRELQETRSRLGGIQKFLGESSQSASPNNATVAHTSAASNTVAATPVPPPTPTQPTAPKPETPVVRRNRAETTEKLNQIIDALVSWNTSQEASDTQLRISIPTIKGLASALGANYQPAIQELLKERAGELEEHHSRLLIGTRHNAGVIKKDEVLQAIARKYLGLENWQDVKYQG